jgi:hypothetical protein
VADPRFELGSHYFVFQDSQGTHSAYIGSAFPVYGTVSVQTALTFPPHGTPFSISELPHHSLTITYLQATVFPAPGTLFAYWLSFPALVGMFSAFSQSLFAYECILHPFEKVMGFGRATRFALRAPF